MPRIRYIGPKPTQFDSVAGTGLTWNGHGDEQNVPAKAAETLLAHPHLWELAESDTNAVPEPDVAPPQVIEADRPPMVNLETMDKTALMQFAQRYFGHEFHHNTGEAKMRQTLLGLMNKG